MALTQFWCSFGAPPILGRFNEPGPEQIDVRPTRHLALEGLEVVNLSLGLPVRPWFPQSCGNRSLISPKPTGEGVEQTLLRLIQPCFRVPESGGRG